MEVLGSFTCRKDGTWDRFFHFPSEGRHVEDYSDTRKIQLLQPCSNPRTRVPEASMLTTRPPKPVRSVFIIQMSSTHRSQITATKIMHEKYSHSFHWHFLFPVFVNIPLVEIIEKKSVFIIFFDIIRS